MGRQYQSSAALARRVRDHRDADAFAQLANRHRPTLKTIQRDYRNQTDVEPDEIAQEALIGFWIACDTYDRYWNVLFHTYAEPIARRRVNHLLRAARTQKARMLRDAADLDAQASEDHASVTVGETIPAPDYWQPEVMSEIRHELRILSSELTQSLSSVEREALGRLMLDERARDIGSAATRVRQKASAALGYQWRTGKRGNGRPAAHTDEARERAAEMYRSGHTQKTIAETLGASQGTVSGWVRGFKRGEREPETAAA